MRSTVPLFAFALAASAPALATEIVPVQQFRSVELGVHVVYPTRKHLPLKLRRLIDFLVVAFRSPSWQ